MSQSRRNFSDRQPFGSRKNRAAIVNLVSWSLLLLFCVFFSFIAGCSSESATSTESGIETDDVQVATAGALSSSFGSIREADPETASGQLVGIWLGAAYFDEDSLAAKLAELNEEERELAMREARYFGATIMAINFRADGTLVNQIEVLPESGSPHQTPEISGTWEVLSEQGSTMVIKTIEQFDDGVELPSQRVFTLYDKDHFAMQVPMAGILNGCRPVMVFERQNLQVAFADEEVVR
ncbi:MAG: hypothetical protein AAF456_09410 [Planctomycetota bacterium]